MPSALPIAQSATSPEVRGYLSAVERAELAYWAGRSNGGLALEAGHFEGMSTCVLLKSLPAGSVLYSVDHHNGDWLIAESEVPTFERNVQPLRGRVHLVPAYCDLSEFFGWPVSGYGFVFYDAEHSPEACRMFWAGIKGRMNPNCTLAFDDADWESMNELGRLAERAGFRDVTRRPLQRLDRDKADPETHTLRIMQRGEVS